MINVWYVVDCKTGKVYWYGPSCKLNKNETLDGYMFGKAKESDPDGAWCCVKGLDSLMECIFKYNELNYESSEDYREACPECETGKLKGQIGDGVKCTECTYWLCY